MNSKDLLINRRSIRRFKDEVVSNEKINYKVVGRISKTNITKVFVELVKIN